MSRKTEVWINSTEFLAYFWSFVTVILIIKFFVLCSQLEVSLKQCLTTLTGGGLYW